MACGEPPEGRASWTLKLLADQLVECEIVGTISTETVRQALKKTNVAEAELVHPGSERGFVCAITEVEMGMRFWCARDEQTASQGE